MSPQSKRKAFKIDDIGLPRSEIEALIDEWVFSQRDRDLAKRRWLDGVCYEPLAEEFDMSVRQVKSIVYKLEGKVFGHYHPSSKTE